MPTRLGVPFLGRRRETASEPPASLENIRDATSPHASPNAQDRHNFSTDFTSSTFPSRRAEILSAAQRGTLSHEPISTPASPAKHNDQFQNTAVPAATQRTTSAQHRRPWRKLLYIPQDYPDDYVDNTFLMELQKNANVRMYNYSTVVMQTTVVTQHISSIAVFIAVFINLYRGALTGNLLL
ncbi:glycosylphosphatidylinositol anchor biosynthesis, partial [Coemansia erecta]